MIRFTSQQSSRRLRLGGVVVAVVLMGYPSSSSGGGGPAVASPGLEALEAEHGALGGRPEDAPPALVWRERGASRFYYARPPSFGILGVGQV